MVVKQRLPQGRGKYRSTDAKVAQGDQAVFRRGLVEKTNIYWFGSDSHLDIPNTQDSTCNFSLTQLIFFPLRRLSGIFNASCSGIRTSGAPAVTVNTKYGIYSYDFSTNEMVLVRRSEATISVTGGVGAACFNFDLSDGPVFYPNIDYFITGITDAAQNIFYGSRPTFSVRYLFHYPMTYGTLPGRIQKNQMTLAYPGAGACLPHIIYRTSKGRLITYA